MLVHKTGNMLTDVTSGIIIHGCNCKGKMGSGIALKIRERWPHVYQAYKDTYENKGLQLGDIIPVEVEPGLFVINCMTQYNYGTDKRYVNYDAVVKCMEAIVELLKVRDDIPSEFNTPLIGAGLAGGKWNIIEAIIDESIPDTIAGKVLWTLPGEKLAKPRVSALFALSV